MKFCLITLAFLVRTLTAAPVICGLKKRISYKLYLTFLGSSKLALRVSDVDDAYYNISNPKD